MRRWQRFGFDRLYGTADGATVGWADLDTGERRIELPELAEMFENAVEAWRNQHLTVTGPSGGSRPPEPSDRPPRLGVKEKAAGARTSDAERTWIDLADNQPGASVRSKALEARRREPLWSLLSRVAGVHTEERAWRVGAKGEELVGKDLAKLDSRWHVLHSIPIGDCSDIDHLVIGPAGVFSLNAKHHKYATVFVDGDLVTVNGHPQPYVEKSRREARRVSQVLSEAVGIEVTAHSVVVVVNAGQLTVHKQPADVLVIDRRRTRRWLLSLAAVYDSTYRERLFQVARRSSTWRI